MSDENIPGFEYPIGTEVRISDFGRRRYHGGTWDFFIGTGAQIWIFEHVREWLTMPEAYYQYGIHTFVGDERLTQYVTARMIERVPLGKCSRRLTVRARDV